MIEIEYTTSANETSKATLDFMSNRPMMSLLFKSMQILCIGLCAGYAISLYTHTARKEDATAVIFALLWIIFYKRFNRWIINHTIKLRKFSEVKCAFKIDDKSIYYQLHTNQPLHVEWKKLKYVFKNGDGYIIPLTGVINAGRFLWLPKRSFKAAPEELTFLDLCQKFKLELKSI